MLPYKTRVDVRAITGGMTTTGTVRFDGNVIKANSPEAAARLGVAHVPEGRGTLSALTVCEKLALGPYTKKKRLLLLDEPSLGIAPLVVRDIFQLLATINNEENVTILISEQNARLALAAASNAYVLETGRIAVSGSASELNADESIRKSYLGY